MGDVSINKGNASNIMNCETAIVFGDVKGNIANADIVVVYGDIKGNMLNVDTIQYRTRDAITDEQVKQMKKKIDNENYEKNRFQNTTMQYIHELAEKEVRKEIEETSSKLKFSRDIDPIKSILC